MVIAINNERSFAASVRKEVHLKASLVETGVSVGYCFHGYKWPRCFLNFLHFVFCLRGNRQFFHSYTPRTALVAAALWGLAHCCPLFGLPFMSRRRAVKMCTSEQGFLKDIFKR